MKERFDSLHDKNKAIREIQCRAAENIIQQLKNFSVVYSEVWWPFLSGQKHSDQPFNNVVSPLLFATGDIISSIEFYRKVLKVSRHLEEIVFIPAVFKWLKAFFVCLKHCTNPSDWIYSDNLIRQLAEFENFLKSEILSPQSLSFFDQQIDRHFSAIVDIISGALCTAVVRRESDINYGLAQKLPCCDDSDSSEEVDDATFKRHGMRAFRQAADIYNFTMPVKIPREFIYELVDRIKTDKRIFPHGCSIKSAVNYIRSGTMIHKDYISAVSRARMFVKEEEKFSNRNPDSVWNSIQSESRPSRRKKNKRRRAENAPPGPCSIPVGW